MIISAHHNVRLRLIADGGQVDAQRRFAIGGDFADQVNTLRNSNLAESTGGGHKPAERQFANRWQVVDARSRHFAIDIDDANITLNMDLVAGTDQDVLRQIALLQLLPVNDDDARLTAVRKTEIHRLLQCATVRSCCGTAGECALGRVWRRQVGVWPDGPAVSSRNEDPLLLLSIEDVARLGGALLCRRRMHGGIRMGN